jgi:peptidoglycan hydrolase CwlO-like protein
MSKRITAQFIALILAAAALSAPAETVDDELAAYWEKADPLYAQIQALGERQSEIYQEFNLSLDDTDDTVMDDAQYEEYVRGLNVLTDDELKKLTNANAEIVKLSSSIDELTAQYDASDDPTEQGVLDSLIHYRQNQIDQITKSVADLDDKLRVAEETNYVMGLAGLTDAARSELLGMYATQRDVEKQIAALDDTLSGAAKAQLYGEGG